MDTSVGGMLIMGVMLAGIILMSRALIVADVTTGAAIKDAAEVSGERARTELTFVASSVSGSTLIVDVNNTGQTSIRAYDRMDFIVSYEPTSGGTEISRVDYNPGSSANNTWEITSRTPDTYQPGTWNPGEVMKLDANLPGPPKTGIGQVGIVYVVSPNGVVSLGTFDVP